MREGEGGGGERGGKGKGRQNGAYERKKEMEEKGETQVRRERVKQVERGNWEKGREGRGQ